jgi:hypothetical protein
MGAGVEERERIVDAGVDIDDEGFGLLGHERRSPRGLMPRSSR